VQQKSAEITREPRVESATKIVIKKMAQTREDRPARAAILRD
jgi:hypothetical protein